MTEKTGRTLTLDGLYKYEIRISGHAILDRYGWVGATQIEVTDGPSGSVTVIRGTYDQAALHGALRGLYSLGYPIIRVEAT